MAWDWLNIFRRENFEELTNARLHSVLKSDVERVLCPRGFEEAGELKWVRDRYAPIRHVFTFFKLKGGVFTPEWGVSLDFVPHVSGGQVRWHRTSKAARLDLCHGCQDRTLYMPYTRGEAPVRQKQAAVIAEAVSRAEDFWGRCETFADLPSAIARLRADLKERDLGFDSFTQHALATAFIHAKSGHPDAALAALQAGKQRWKPEVFQRLAKLVSEAHPD